MSSDLWPLPSSSETCKDTSIQLDLTEKEKEGSVEGEGTGGRWSHLSLPSPEGQTTRCILKPDPGQQRGGASSCQGLLSAGQGRCGAAGGRGEVEGEVGGEWPHALVRCPHRAVLWLLPGHCSRPQCVPAGQTPEAIWSVCWFPRGQVIYRKLHSSQLASPAAPLPGRNTTPATYVI